MSVFKSVALALFLSVFAVAPAVAGGDRVADQEGVETVNGGGFEEAKVFFASVGDFIAESVANPQCFVERALTFGDSETLCFVEFDLLNGEVEADFPF